MRQPLRPRAINITYPKPVTALNIVTGGTTYCKGAADQGGVNADKAYAKIYRVGQTIPPPGAIGQEVDCVNGIYEFAAVTNALGTADGTDNNVMVVNARVNGVFIDVAQTRFIGQSQPFTKPVPATACLWFAFAPAGATGPAPWSEVVDSHRPIRLEIPVRATKVNIQASGVWRHHPATANESGPEGLAGSGVQGLAHQEYKNNYGNSKLQDGRFLLNRLVGFWEPLDHADLAEFPMIGIDNGADIAIPVDVEYKALWLGFHDSFEWNNNNFEVQAIVEWSV